MTRVGYDKLVQYFHHDNILPAVWHTLQRNTFLGWVPSMTQRMRRRMACCVDLLRRSRTERQELEHQLLRKEHSQDQSHWTRPTVSVGWLASRPTGAWLKEMSLTTKVSLFDPMPPQRKLQQQHSPANAAAPCQLGTVWTARSATT